ncbi:MAG TPA: hypothetical protein VMF08_09310 [Candidatus Sulfotelmatobacter sp.]|nr:hypothetical protein [Candidatus Sulfotelmatobacter sp.]
MKTRCNLHEPCLERGCVEDQPQHAAILVSAAAGAPSPPTQPRSNPPIQKSINPFLVLVLIALVPLAGCVTKATADAQARAAFLAGEKAAYQNMQSSQTAIVVLGEVQKHQVPWVAGLTLAQAISTAGYNGAHDPTEIILRRNSVQTEIDPKQLLNGNDVPLQPGDVVSILSQ